MQAKIKICGVTSKKDALELVKYDVYALGFAPISERFPSRFHRAVAKYGFASWVIDLTLATEIIRTLQNEVIAVFAVAYLPIKEIINICKVAGVGAVQLQKGSTIADIKKIKQEVPNLKVWKTIFTRTKPDLDKVRAFEEASDAILIHSRGEEWLIGLEIARVLRKPFILAGGLNLENVERAIKLFKPFAIDLIGGVETTPGRKDFRKVKALIEKVQGIQF